ncbi:MAG: chemotaxis-specific protein-glutamate methyltransferase CheB [Halobacteriaceae archaeon]
MRDVDAVVVDDSRFMRTMIVDMLEDAGIAVAAEAENGVEAVERVREERPDVVTMDVEMPRMDGIEAVERIMEEVPTPVLMLSAHTEDGSEVAFEAMERGAVDVFTKPGGEISAGMTTHEDRLVEKVVSVANSDVMATRVGRSSGTATATETAGGHGAPTLVVGASTGGPNVVERVLADLPRAANFRVLVVQHMPDEFTNRFAARLDERTEYDVWEAADGDRVAGGEAVVARGGHHLRAASWTPRRLRVELTDDPPEHGVRPAVDVTLRSVAEVVDGALTAVVLTGMGRDGAEGVEAVAAAGGRVLAQDEATAVVYGMPGAAVETGCVGQVLPVENIAKGIIEATEGVRA